MARPPRIDVVRLWIQRHAHHNLHLAEDGQGRIWLRLRDLRHWMPGLPPDADMLRRLPTQLGLADGSREPYIDTDALPLLTRKAQNPATLKLLAWLEANVLHPSRRRFASAPPARTVLPPWWAAGIDPRWWFIAQGRWAPWRTAITGLVIGLAGWLASRLLALQTWTVEGPYGLWLWLAALTGLWCTVWCGAWVVGSIRSASRHADEADGRTAWTPLLLGLGGAPVLALATVLGLGGLLQAWWSTTVRGDGAAVVTPLSDADGQVRALRISGTLGMGSTQALQAALQAHPQVERLEIHSPGGLVTEGHGMAQLALQRALNTEARVACEAACTLVFVAGEKRLIAREAGLGFGGMLPSLAPVVADFYRQRGVPEDFVQQALGRRSWQPGVTSAESAVASGLAAPAATP